MAERFLIRTIGGPTNGETRVVNADGQPGEPWTWPLPDTLHYPGTGYYKKTSESKLGPRDVNSHVLRGAEYHWVESD